MVEAFEIRQAVLEGEKMIQVNVPYETDEGESEEFEAQLPESFATESIALERAENRLPEDVTFTGTPYRVGPIPNYDPAEFVAQ